MQTEKYDPAYIWDMMDAAKTTLQLTEGVTLQSSIWKIANYN
jgi:hypothetical protein